MANKEVDILILGATGYTGRLVSQHLSHQPEWKELQVGFAGRRLDKLQTLLSNLNISEAKVKTYSLPDINDEKVLDDIISRAKLVINCVGPFYLTGTPIVRSCVRNGTHYVDVTAEAYWIKDMINDFDYLARKNNVALIFAAGQDSVPADLTAYLSARTAKAAFGSNINLASSKSGVWMVGAVSGGSIKTMISSVEDVPPHKLKGIEEGYALSPVKGINLPRQKLYYSLPFTSWQGGVSMMKHINIPIVQMTWGLFERFKAQSSNPTPADIIHYGPNFVYEEFWAVRGSYSLLRSILFSLSLLLTWAVLPLSRFLRNALKNSSPSPGQGPSEEEEKKGQVEVMNVTITDETDPRYVRSFVKFNMGPYLVTAVCVSATALCMLFDQDKLTPLAKEGGALTAVAACGDALLERLKLQEGFSHETEVINEKEDRKTR